MIVVRPIEARHRTTGKAHRLEYLRITRIGVGDGIACNSSLLHGAAQLGRLQLCDDREHGQDEAAEKNQRAKIGVQNVDEQQKKRHPGKVQQRHRALASQKAAHRVHVATTLQ